MTRRVCASTTREGCGEASNRQFHSGFNCADIMYSKKNKRKKKIGKNKRKEKKKKKKRKKKC